MKNVIKMQPSSQLKETKHNLFGHIYGDSWDGPGSFDDDYYYYFDDYCNTAGGSVREEETK